MKKKSSLNLIEDKGKTRHKAHTFIRILKYTLHLVGLLLQHKLVAIWFIFGLWLNIRWINSAADLCNNCALADKSMKLGTVVHHRVLQILDIGPSEI